MRYRVLFLIIVIVFGYAGVGAVELRAQEMESQNYRVPQSSFQGGELGQNLRTFTLSDDEEVEGTTTGQTATTLWAQLSWHHYAGVAVILVAVLGGAVLILRRNFVFVRRKNPRE